MIRVVNVHEAKSNLSRLLERVLAGDRVVIARAGKPVAELVPHRGTEVVLGTGGDGLRYDADTFDDPDDRVVAVFEGR